MSYAHHCNFLHACFGEHIAKTCILAIFPFHISWWGLHVVGIQPLLRGRSMVVVVWSEIRARCVNWHRCCLLTVITHTPFKSSSALDLGCPHARMHRRKMAMWASWGLSVELCCWTSQWQVHKGQRNHTTWTMGSWVFMLLVWAADTLKGVGANYFDRVCAVRPHCVSNTYLDSETGAINNNKASDYTQMIFHL